MKQFLTNRKSAHLLLVIMALVWGASFLASKHALEELTVVQLLASRFLIAYLALFSLHSFATSHKLIHKTDLLFLIALSLIEPIGYFLLETTAIKLTSPVNVSILIALSPLTITLNAQILMKEKTTPYFYYGLIVSIIGVGVALSGGSDRLSVTFGIGELMAIAGCILVSFYVLVARKLSQKYTPYQITRFQLGFGSVFFIILTLAEADFSSGLNFSSSTIASVIGLGLFASALGYFCLNYSYSKLPARQIGLIGNFIPLVTLAVAALLPNGTFSATQFIGVLIAFVGLTICIYREKKSATHQLS